MKVTISLGQMDAIRGAIEANLAAAQKMTEEAARRGSDIIVFPELWACGYDLEHAERYASPFHAGVFAEMADWARHYGLYILGSELSLDQQGQVRNAAALFDRQGKLAAVYNKIHLFGPMGDKHHLTSGEKPVLADLPWGLAGLGICYDLRFPELSRAYGLAGANMIFYPSAWPFPRQSHWRTLLRARAIENQLFIVACNRVGTAGATLFLGHSTIINPYGDIVVEGGEGEMLLTADIELEQVQRFRDLFDVYADRRPESYRLA